MAALSALRQAVFDFRKRVFRKPKHRMVPIVDGLPEIADREMIGSICRDRFGEEIVSAQHQHLSGWKSTGAYRLLLRTASGSVQPVIFKEAVYTESEIPALQGLPARPGPAEYTVYRSASGPLQRFLPEIYFAQEIIPGRRYRYMMEDLAQSYHRVSSEVETVAASQKLTELHQALREWGQQVNTEHLISYGKLYSAALQRYAYTKLSAYDTYANEPILKTVLHAWDQIASLHLSPEFFDDLPLSAIHGDTNYTNIHFHNSNPDLIKYVDWEWAGIGSPTADLVSLLKSASKQVEANGIQAYYTQLIEANAPNLPYERFYRHYLWAQIERAMSDAAFLSAQQMGTDHETGFDLSKAVTRALQRMFQAYQRLTA